MCWGTHLRLGRCKEECRLAWGNVVWPKSALLNHLLNHHAQCMCPVTQPPSAYLLITACSLDWTPVAHSKHHQHSPDLIQDQALLAKRPLDGVATGGDTMLEVCIVLRSMYTSERGPDNKPCLSAHRKVMQQANTTVSILGSLETRQLTEPNMPPALLTTGNSRCCRMLLLLPTIPACLLQARVPAVGAPRSGATGSAPSLPGQQAG
jgi:hypothetical protein